MNTLTRHPRSLFALTALVSVAACLLLWVDTGCAQEAFRVVFPGQQIAAFRLTSEQDSTRARAPHSAMLIVLWASWSESSLSCLRDINTASGSGALHWEIMAVNLDDAERWTANSAEIIASARAAGIEEHVWRDPDYSLVDDWGVISVPSVIVMGGGGLVEMTVRGWTNTAKAQVLQVLNGTSSQVDLVPVDAGVARCRQGLQRARKLWQSQQLTKAVREVVRVQRLCPDWAGPPLVIAEWSALGADTAAERRWIRAALAADSTDPAALAETAFLALSDGQPEAARMYAERAIAEDSLCAPAWSAYALANLALKKVADAEHAWTILQSLNRFDPEYNLIAARLHEAKGESALAASFWRRVIERELAERERPLSQRSRRLRP